MAAEAAEAHRGPRIMAFWLAVILVTLFDQATKAVVREVLQTAGASRPFIPYVMELRLVYNTGAAFSIGTGAGIVFIAIAAIVLVVLAGIVWRDPGLPLSLSVSMGCVAGGGVGNMIDRVIHGAVTDFLCTTFIDFPVFNVADIFVTCGLALTFILYLRFDRKERAQERA